MTPSLNLPFKMVSNNVAAIVQTFCLKNLEPICDQLMKDREEKDQKDQKKKKQKKSKEKTENLNPTQKRDLIRNNKIWKRLEPLMKSFLNSTVHLLKSNPDKNVLITILKHLEKYALYFGFYENIAKKTLRVSPIHHHSFQLLFKLDSARHLVDPRRNKQNFSFHEHSRNGAQFR
jgi:hypothetical protein